MTYQLSPAEREAVKAALYIIIEANFTDHDIARDDQENPEVGQTSLSQKKYGKPDKDVQEILVPFNDPQHGPINIHVLVSHNVWKPGPGRPRKDEVAADRKKVLRTTWYDPYKATKDTLAAAEQVTDDPLAGAGI